MSTRRSLELTDDQWQRLEALAVEFEAVAAGGPNTNFPSWRALIRDLAQGKLILQRPTN